MHFDSRETSNARIAVVGGGVAGIVAAYLLQKKHAVTLLDAGDYLGGHTHTIDVPSDGGHQPVDTGFIVFNNKTYPNFIRFLNALDVRWRDTDMSFGFDDRVEDLQYAGTDLSGLFAQRSNLIRPTYWRFLWGIARFCQATLKGLEEGALQGLSLEDHLRHSETPHEVIHNYVLPMAAAIWSSPDEVMTQFPAESFARFFKNHGLLSPMDRPVWHTVEGGSRTYVEAFQKTFGGHIRLNAVVQEVRRTAEGVEIQIENCLPETFDAVVLACHADQAFRLLADPSSNETRLLDPWDYSENRVELHTDARFLPRNPRARASWNYLRESEDEKDLSLTYHMNRLQGIPGAVDYCVTLNGRKEVDPRHKIGEYSYAHPIYTTDSMTTQKTLPQLNAANRTWFCGSYFGYGFHEDAVRSAVAVGADFGVELS